MDSLDGHLLSLSVIVYRWIHIAIGSTSDAPLQHISVIYSDEAVFAFKLRFAFDFRLHLPDHLDVLRLILLLSIFLFFLLDSLSRCVWPLCYRWLFICCHRWLLTCRCLIMLSCLIFTIHSIRLDCLAALGFLVFTEVIIELLLLGARLLLLLLDVHAGSAWLTCIGHAWWHLSFHHVVLHLCWMHLGTIRHLMRVNCSSCCAHCPGKSSKASTWTILSSCPWWNVIVIILLEHWRHSTLLLLPRCLIPTAGRRLPLMMQVGIIWTFSTTRIVVRITAHLLRRSQTSKSILVHPTSCWIHTMMR